MKIQLPLTDEAKAYIKQIGFMAIDEYILDEEIAGEGNMNVVLRIKTNKIQSYILKQSRPYVQKYPQIAAPQERILTEIAYYKALVGNELLENYSPKILWADEPNYLIVMSDLGQAADFMGVYSKPALLTSTHLKELMQYLSALHSLEIGSFVPNTAMKILNHEHIFNFPFDIANNFDLNTVQEGLAEISEIYKNDTELKRKIRHLGEKYLESGKSLLHGDFYPGSFMQTHTGLKIIDPEFAFMGEPEFDLGVLKAHLLLAGNEAAETFLDNYTLEINLKLVNAYAGIEILRRLLGIAQLPLSLEVNSKRNFCELAKNMVELY